MNKQKKFNQQNSKLILEELEERRLFSGGIEGLIVTGLDSDENALYADADANKSQSSDTTSKSSTTAAEQQSQEIVFVDAGVDNHQQLVDDLLANSDSNRNIEVVVLDRDQDGIEQISAVLQDRDDLDAVHIISHGSDGSVQLGDTSLNSETLEDNNHKIALWANSFAETGDILIYGCNLAATEAGQSLIDDLSSLTLTDVAASTDTTGHESLGGDWDLEYRAGDIEAEIASSAELQARYEYILAVINGTAGDDVLLGTASNDTISADAGNDVLVGGGGSDQLLGEAGADVFRFTGAQDGDVYTVDGGSESDTIDLSEFGSGTVIDDGATITVDLGAGQSFTINYTNIENVVTADTAGNHGPEAIAQIREAYAEGDGITINGTLSDDFDGDALTYQWAQIGGPAVTLNNATTSAASFTAPAVASPTTFTFELVVSDGTTSHIDTVETTVLPLTSGGFGNDNLAGTADRDALDGGIFGNDTLDGGDGDDLLSDAIGDDVLIGGAGHDVVDYTGAGGGVTVDITITGSQATGGAGNDSLSGIEGVLGAGGDDRFGFSNPADGAVYTVDGYGGFNTIDLSGFASSEVTFGDHALTVDMGGGQSFTIEYAKINEIEFSDIIATVLSADMTQAGFSGSGLWIDGAEAFKIELTGGGTVDLAYDKGSDTLTVSNTTGTGSGTALVIDDLNGTDLRIDQIAVSTDLGSITSDADIGAVDITGGDFTVSTITVDGGAGKIGSFTTTAKIITPTTINANIDSVTLLDVDATIDFNGDVGSIDVGKVSADIHVTGSLGSWTTTGDLSAALQVDGDLGSLSSSAGLTATGSIVVDGNLGGTVLGDIDGTFSVAGNLTSLSAGGISAGPEITIGGDVGSITTTNTLSRDITIGGDLDSASFTSIDVAATVTANQVVGTLVFDVGGTDHGDTYANPVLYMFDGATQTANVAPVAVADSVSTSEDTAVVIDVLANDSDPDSDPLTTRMITGPSNGTLVPSPIELINETNLTNDVANDREADWSPDGSQIVFRSDRGASNDIWVMNADGSGLTQLTFDTGFDSRPVWSPDGTQILFTSDRSGDDDIWIMNADGSGKTNLTNNALGDDTAATWSPDGSQIAFKSNRDSNDEIYVMNADGSGQVNITNDAAKDSGPSWSPDGTKLLFVSDRGTNTDVWVMDTDGSNPINLTNSPTSIDSNASWSADGSKIVFKSDRDGGNTEIYVMDANGANPTRLTDNAFVDGAPSWSPDGSQVIYQTNRVGNHEIYIADISSDGTFTYTPDAGFTGVDSFTYVANDGSLDSAVTTVTITVNPINFGTAIWRDGSTTPQTSDWDGSSFGSTTVTAPAGDYRIMQGAEAPTRDEIIIIGVDESSQINGEIWNGSSWSVLPSGTLGSPLGTVSQNYWWSMDVAYEQQSGDAVMVWADGTELKSSVWDGSNWTVPTVVNDFGGTTPRQIQLASQPSGDEMVMVVSDSSGNDTAWVWDGSSWTSQRSLDTSGGNLTTVYVSYEQQSGDALVTYGKSGDANVYYQIWNGTSWSAEASVVPPGGVTSSANWVTLGSDPGSDRIVMGVVTSGGTAADIWLSVWNGSSWEASLQAETSATGSVYPNVAVAFESTSGQAIAVYGENGSNTVKYRTWDSGSGWSTEQIGPDIGGEPNSLMLAADPISDQIMLSAQDANSDVNYVLWDGAAWGATTELATATTEVKNQPFLFLWDQAPVNDAPVAVDDTVAIDENTANSTTVTTVSATGATEGQYAEMYWADKVDNAIYKANADGTGGTTTVISGLNAPVGVEVDYNGGKLYWTTNVAGDASVIQSANLDGTGLTTLVTGLTDPDSIALDLTNGKMYWTDDNSGEIRRANLDGSAVEIVLSGLTNPESVALDVDSGKMYWTDHGDLKIQRANLDGTGVEDLVTTGLSNVGDVELDLDNGKMYWIDGAIGKIQRANLDGTGVEDLVTSGLGDAYYLALDVSAGKMYWTDDGDNIIQRANLDGTGIEDLVTTGVDNPRDLALSAPATLAGPLSYSITAGNTGNAFTIDANTGEITVADSNVLDFETTPVFNLTVEVQDTVSLLTDTATITVSLNNINEIVNSVPGPQTTNEDTALVFSTANSNLVSINDPEAGGGEIAVTLVVNDGTLTLSGTAGLTFVAGNDNSASMTFTGTLLDINAALDGLTFMPDPDYTGAVNLQVTSHDDTSLLGIYTFDDPASPGNDGSPGSLNDGVVNGATPVYDATRGDVLSFDGVDDGVQISGLLGEPADVTLSAWINFTKTDPGEVISLGGSVLLRAGDWGASDGIRTSYYDGSWQNLDFSTPITGTGWRHVAFVFDDTNDMRRLYLDGVEVASAVTTTSIIHGVDADTFIGQHPTDPSNFFFEGMIDDARIYDRALTAAEITSNMNGVPTSDIDNVAITVNNVNDAPVMTAWFNDAWDTRKELSISAVQVAGDVTNFPVLITLNTDAELAAQALANGDDIVFTAADGVTQLAHEIEFFDETTGELRVWVKADLSGSIDTNIYMYFGNAASGPQENPPAVWDNYVGVYHLGESPDGTPGELSDSSGSGNHATTEGSMNGADSVGTTVGQGLAFDGVDDLIRIPDSATLDSINDEATFSLWINFVDAADGDTQIIMSSSNRYSGWDGYEWANQGTGDHFFYPDAMMPDVNYNQGSNPFTNSTWHHLAATMDFTTQEVKIYVDGTPMTFTYEGVPGNWTSLSSSDDMLWGGNPDRATRYFLGMMDEIRIADVVRSQEWIQTEVNNQSAPGTFFSLGTTEDREDKLTDIAEDNFTSAGDSVLSIITSSGANRITDADTGAVEGIAVTAVDNTNGQWQYDANADGTWLAFGSVSDTDAVLLDTGALIRFVPNADYNGSAGDLTFHAWDQTSGANGDTGVDVSTNGGSTAYSSETFDATLNVLPVADAPTFGGTDTGSVQEDVGVVANNISTGGLLTIADPDTGESTFQAETVTGTYGDLAIDTAGNWTYTADNTQAAIQQLDVSEFLTDTLTVTSFDGTTHNVVITINGSEDAAVISGTTTGSVTEDGTLTSSGALTITDTDTSDSPSFADVGVTAGDNAYGTFEMTAGTWTYTLNNAHPAVQALDVSETLTDTFTFTATDGSPQLVTVTINGAEDAPVFDSSAVTAATEDVAYSYTITTSDVDVESVTITAPTLPAWLTFVDNGDGTATLSGTPTNAEVGNHNVVLNVSDGTLSSNQNFTITVANTNDPAVIGGTDTGSVQEDVGVVANNISTGGLLTIADPDTGESTFQAETVTGTYGDLAIDTAGNWTYTADNTQAAIQQLDVSEFLTDTLTVTSFDGTTHNVVITINGSEDAAVISGTTTGSVTEDGTLTSSGALTITDTDTSDSPSFADVGVTAGDNAYGTFEMTAGTWTYTLNNAHPAVQALDVSETLTDTFTFTATDGSPQLVTVTINGAEDAPVFDSSAVTAATEDVAYSYTITTSDVDVESVTITAPTLPAWLTFVDNGDGTATLSGTPTNAEVGNHNVVLNVSDGTLSSNQNFTITVANTNDPAVIGGTDTGSVQEDVGVVANNISTGGLLTIADPDTGESTFQAETVTGTYGDLAIDTAGNWTYTADNTQAAIQQLDVSEFLTDTLTVTSFDGTTHNVVITINGSEDAAVISGTTTGSVTEDGTLTSSGALTITDTDTSDSPSFADVGVTAGDNAYGTFEMTAGTWTYTLNNAHPAVQALDVSETLTDTFTFTATDGSPQLVTVTINGAEDAPVFDSSAVTAATEDVAYSYTITTSDVDVESVTITAPTLPAWLTFVDNGDGTATLSGTPTNAEVGNHNVVLNVSDGTLSSNQNFTITVANTNDPAVIGGTDTGSVQEDVGVVANNISTGGLLTIADPDTGESTFQAETVTGTYGDLAIDTAGNWTYTADNTQAAIQQLDVSEFLTDTLTVTSFDGTTHNVVITINGSEDAAVISGTTTGSVTEDGTLTSSGALTITDTDTSDSPSFADVGVTAGDNAYGTFEMTAGTWTYTLNNAHPAVQALDVSETLTDTFTFTATDGSPQLVTVTINGAEDAPVFDSSAVTAATEDVAYSYTITTSDVDVESVTITAPTLPAWLTFVDNGDGTATLSGTPTNAEVGNHNVVLNVSDGTLSSNQNFTITVNDINTAPVLGAIGNQSVDELATLSFTATATDADLPVDTLTFSLDGASLAAGMTIDANTGAFSWTPTEGQGGSTPSVTITVTDSGTGNLVDSETFTITVNDVNTAPVLGAIGNQSVDELTTLSFTATATDADLPVDTLTFSLDGASLAAGMTIDANTGAFSWTPTEGQGGSTPSVTITVTDSGTGNLVDSETFTITVNDVNTAPVLGAIGNQSVDELTTLSFTATATDADLPVDTLTFSLDAASLAAGMTIDANTGAFSWTPTEGQGGSTPSVTITVTDSGTGNLIDSETFTITVNDVNSAPIIGGTDTGVVTEDRVDSTGKLSVAGALTISDADVGESSFLAQTIQGNFGNLTIDAAGNWSYSADNSHAEIQALQAGESMTEIMTVTTADGSTHDVEIIINGVAEAPPAPPPPEEPPPEEEPPADEPPDEVEEEQVVTGDDQILEEIVQVPQGIRSPDPQQDSGFAQANDSDSEPVDYPVIDKQPAKLPEQPQVQALKAQNLSIDTLTLQVSNDEALNEQYELELLERIDSMHLGMDLEAAQQNADDVDVQIFVGSTAGLTVGIVSWVLRGGALLASFMSTVPLLNRFDPLPILKAREDEEDVEPDDDDDEKTQIREHARKVDNMFSENGDRQ